ncbi:MAG: type 2 isopentenyl-diphosphate Delta-isomerase, partial [Ignisphaera sp.]
MDTSISNRKEEHIVQALKPENQGPLSTHLEDVILIHQPLVEVSYDEVSLETEFLGYRLGAPIIISSMTGGTAMSYDINKKLASTAEKYKL